MKKLILTTSIITLSLAGTAFAEDIRANAQIKTETLGNKIENAIDKTTNKVEQKYNDLKVSVMNKDTRETRFTDQSLNSEYTAKKLIGKTIVNANNEKVGTLSDIIVDAKGNAEWVIVADGDFVGVGKKAAFKYNNIISQKDDGDVVASISEAGIKAAKEFSDDPKDAKDGKVTIPTGSYSIKELMDADVKTADKDVDLELKNITFNGSHAQYFVFENEKTSPDSYAGIAFDSVKLLPKGDNKVDLQLSAAQEKSLAAHTKTSVQ